MNIVSSIKQRLDDGENPRDIKKELAREIVTMYHGVNKAIHAEEQWTSEVSQKNLTDDVRIIQLGVDESIIDLLVRLDIAKSRSRARRLIRQNAIKVNDTKITNDGILANGDILRVGKKHTFKIKT